MVDGPAGQHTGHRGSIDAAYGGWEPSSPAPLVPAVEDTKPLLQGTNGPEQRDSVKKQRLAADYLWLSASFDPNIKSC